MERAKKIFEKEYGKDHVEVAKTLNSLEMVKKLMNAKESGKNDETQSQPISNFFQQPGKVLGNFQEEGNEGDKNDLLNRKQKP